MSMGFDSKCDFVPPTIFLVLLLFFGLGRGVPVFSGIQHSPVNGCSAVSCNFGVLTGEDENMSFYSAIFCQIHFEYRCWDLCFLMKILVRGGL